MGRPRQGAAAVNAALRAPEMRRRWPMAWTDTRRPGSATLRAMHSTADTPAPGLGHRAERERKTLWVASALAQSAGASRGPVREAVAPVD